MGRSAIRRARPHRKRVASVPSASRLAVRAVVQTDRWERCVESWSDLLRHEALPRRPVRPSYRISVEERMQQSAPDHVVPPAGQTPPGGAPPWTHTLVGPLSIKRIPLSGWYPQTYTNTVRSHRVGVVGYFLLMTFLTAATICETPRPYASMSSAALPDWPNLSLTAMNSIGVGLR